MGGLSQGGDDRQPPAEILLLNCISIVYHKPLQHFDHELAGASVQSSVARLSGIDVLMRIHGWGGERVGGMSRLTDAMTETGLAACSHNTSTLIAKHSVIHVIQLGTSF